MFLCAGLLGSAGLAHAQTPSSVVTLNLPPVWKEAGGQARLSAERVAREQAYRSLIERIYGLPINSTTTVHDLILADDGIKTSISRSIVGVAEVKPTSYFDDGRLELDCAVAIASVKETLKREVEKKSIAGITLTEKDWSDFEYKTTPKILIETGTGALSNSEGYQRILARRSAELDGYRLLAERMLGVQVTSESSVKNFVLESDYIRSRVAGVLKGAKKKAVRYVTDDNTCEVDMEVNLVNVFEVIKSYSAKKDGKVSSNRIEISERTEPMTFSATGKGASRPPDWQRTILEAQNPSRPAEAFQETYTIIERLIGQRLEP